MKVIKACGLAGTVALGWSFMYFFIMAALHGGSFTFYINKLSEAWWEGPLFMVILVVGSYVSVGLIRRDKAGDLSL